jgi:hypothetical protein
VAVSTFNGEFRDFLYAGPFLVGMTPRAVCACEGPNLLAPLFINVVAPSTEMPLFNCSNLVI